MSVIVQQLYNDGDGLAIFHLDLPSIISSKYSAHVVT